METKCLDGHRVATFILGNQKSAHQMLPRAGHLTQMPMGPEAKWSIPAPSKGQMLLGSPGSVLPDVQFCAEKPAFYTQHEPFGYKVFSVVFIGAIYQIF